MEKTLQSIELQKELLFITQYTIHPCQRATISPAQQHQWNSVTENALLTGN